MIFRKSKISQTLYCTLISITLILVNLPAIFRHFGSLLENGFGVNNFTSDVAIIFGINFAFFTLLFSINKLLGRLIAAMSISIASIYSYYVVKINVYLYPAIIQGVFVARKDDAIGMLIDWQVYLYGAVGILVALYFCFKFNISKIKNKLEHIKNTGIIAISIIIFALITNLGAIKSIKIENAQSQIFPIALLQTKYIKLLTRQEIVKYDYRDFKYANDQKDPLKVVFILGESLRADRLGLNGYKRNTTPLLEKVDNLVSFGKATSCATATNEALRCVLSDIKYGDLNKIKQSFVPIFTNLGFKTHWYSAQNRVQIHNLDFFGANKILFSQDLSSLYLKPDIKDMDLLNLIEIDNGRNEMYFFHTIGSHEKHSERYPRDFAIFTPDLGSSEDEFDNSYDNSVLYTDTFINSVIDKFKTENAIIIFTSDHGNSLPSDHTGFASHATPIEIAPKEQREVPLLIYYSDKYRKYNPEKVKKIIAKSKSEKDNLKHDAVFHTVLRCGGVISGVINSELSLC